MDEELGLTATAARPVVGGWNLANADRFKLLEAQGVDPQSAWKMTGTWRGKDGRLRQRIAGASALQGYGQASPISEMIGGFTGAPRRFSVMDPEAQRMQTARDIGEQASVAGQMFGAITPFAASAAAAKAGQMMGVSPLTVYHGTPHRFSKFDSSKIGTGEGAQMYGRGLYFAEHPKVAKKYARTESDYKRMTQGFEPKVEFAYDLFAQGLDEKQVLDEFISKYRNNISFDEAMNAINEAKKYANAGYFYTVDLPDEKIAKMLDWDKPLSQQPKEVQSMIFADIDAAIDLTNKSLVGASDRKAFAIQKSLSELQKERSRLENLTGGNYYNQLSLGSKQGQQKASEELRNLGIPGIRYLDQGSRGTGKGTSNFVVFPGEEEALTILRQE